MPVPTRLVAIAVSPMELLRPESDLARLVRGAGQVDLLTACEDGPVGAERTVTSYLDYPDYDDEDEDEVSSGDDPDELLWLPAHAEPVDEVRSAVARLDLPDLRLHRLGLRSPLGPGTEPDLVAALSELVGFDPEPGVYCLAPASAPGDPNRSVVVRAAQRIARVYGLPMLRYRCLALSVVADPP
ncbi:hypothetical protein ACVGVM_22965 [Pseudonocardia bannensis]|uniref:Uncharacterized protein n=1 Tax=Pseudonocardia bannensis TaxID=630973 RepID=A0A848DP44_9PSEU|nr:hypothetical protein [Pseudonocardia bannensis]NMH94283.1 hypothetical protein [Pseudonocardia bannensis]